ncbi:hypothetical protein F5Y14DRAFT_420328 [Nemania sp. NC0429]|nr:hypothetical protein F5Y14DRAFT_420328 [Nemania sp. NC0429]
MSPTSTSTPSSPSSPSSQAPTIRRPDTGCTATLSAGLAPARISHTPRCQCLCACAAANDDENEDEKVAGLVSSMRTALLKRLLESEKPALCFAMILLGAEVVY